MESGNGLRSIIENPFMQLLSYMVGIVGLMATIIMRPRKKTLKKAISNFIIVKGRRDALSKLTVSYNGSEIDGLTVTKFAIWNGCRTVIRKNDIATEEPIKITTDKEGKILDISLIKATNQSSKVQIIKRKENEYIIDFEYLEKNDGAIIQVLHTGSREVFINGKIIGGNKIREIGNVPRIINIVFYKRVTAKTVSIIMMFLYSIAVLMANLEFFDVIPRIAYNKTYWPVIFTTILGFVIFTLFYRLVRTGVPKSLQAYDRFVDKESKELLEEKQSA